VTSDNSVGARQPTAQQWETVSMASVDSSLLGDDDVLRYATIREVLQVVFSIRPVRWLYPSTD
jgi:hypothetical protein